MAQEDDDDDNDNDNDDVSTMVRETLMELDIVSEVERKAIEVERSTARTAMVVEEQTRTVFMWCVTPRLVASALAVEAEDAVQLGEGGRVTNHSVVPDASRIALSTPLIEWTSGEEEEEEEEGGENNGIRKGGGVAMNDSPIRDHADHSDHSDGCARSVQSCLQYALALASTLRESGATSLRTALDGLLVARVEVTSMLHQLNGTGFPPLEMANGNIHNNNNNNNNKNDKNDNNNSKGGNDDLVNDICDGGGIQATSRHADQRTHDLEEWMVSSLLALRRDMRNAMEAVRSQSQSCAMMRRK